MQATLYQWFVGVYIFPAFAEDPRARTRNKVENNDFISKLALSDD